MAKMVPADVEFIERAPLRVDTVIALRQPPRDVWAVLTDNERWPEWFGACKAARTTSERRTGVGSTRWVHVDRFKVNERFIVWDEPHRWGFTMLDTNLPLANTAVELVTLDDDGGGTRLTYTFAMAVKPWLRPLTPVLRWQFVRVLRTSLAGPSPTSTTSATTPDRAPHMRSFGRATVAGVKLPTPA